MTGRELTEAPGAPARALSPQRVRAPVAEWGARATAWTRAALRDLLYSFAVTAWSVAGFTILVTGVAVTSSLLVLVAGVFVWIGFVHVLRWTTWVDRSAAGWQRRERLTVVYRRPVRRGFTPNLKTLTADPQTWKEMAWLGVNSLVGFGGGLAVTTAAGLVVTYVSMPLWFWAVSHPHTEYGVTAFGPLTIDTLGEALLAPVVGFALTPLVLLLARLFAKAHARLATRMLSSQNGALR